MPNLKQIAAPLLLVGLAAAPLAAQVSCYEPALGTALGTGDDVLFAMQPIGFAFPFGGTTYTNVHVSTNGFFYLSNNGVPAPGTANCCNNTVAQLMSGPKVSPFWDDLDVEPVNGGNVFINQLANPQRCVITWQNAVEFSFTNVFSVQCQLYATGEIVMNYSATADNDGGNNQVLVGFSPGGTSSPVEVDLSVGGSTSVTTVFERFGFVPVFRVFDCPARSVIFTPNAGGGYDVDSSTCIGASTTSYGAGCYNNFISFYEDFGILPIDLANTTVMMQPTGNGFVVFPNGASFFAPQSGDLALGDDDISAGLQMPFTFTFPGGSTDHIQVCADGYILLQDGVAAPGAGEYFTNLTTFLTEAPRLAPAWHDWRTGTAPGLGGLGTIHYDIDPSNTAVYVTWNGVGEFGGALTPSTFQVAIFASGQVEFRYQGLAYTDPFGEGSLVGFTQGNGAGDPGNRDLSTTMPFVTAGVDGTPALAVALDHAPILGSTVQIITTNIPATAVLSADLIGFVQLFPGLDLGSIGAPGCVQLVANSPTISVLVLGTPSASLTLPIPASLQLVGLDVFTQSASLVPSVNQLGLLSSNGVILHLNAF